MRAPSQWHGLCTAAHLITLEADMDWSELDALADELRRKIARGSLRKLPPDASDPTGTLTPEVLARITLGDIAHLREWERTHPMARTPIWRLQELADDAVRWLGTPARAPTQRCDSPPSSSSIL
jgi:hypothetical protein